MISIEKFNLFVWIWIIAGIIAFPFLLRIPQPYGRHSNNNWGPMIDNRLGWFLMELPALLVFAFTVSFTGFWYNLMLLAATFLWFLHYVHRAVIFPLRLKTKGKKMPVVIMFSAIFFNLVNGFINGYWLAFFAPEDKIDFNTDVRIIAGVAIFFTGFIINQHHDEILINLRKGENKGYRIPHGGLFKFVSCPNYLGEIISWVGFYVVTLSLPALAFLIWTLANLIPRAIDHHKWYRKEFAEYPAKRKAVIPFIL